MTAVSKSGKCRFNYSPQEGRALSLNLEQYLSAVKRFDESVSDLAGKFDQIKNSRAEVLKASEELRAGLDTSDRRLREICFPRNEHADHVYGEDQRRSAMHSRESLLDGRQNGNHGEQHVTSPIKH